MVQGTMLGFRASGDLSGLPVSGCGSLAGYLAGVSIQGGSSRRVG